MIHGHPIAVVAARTGLSPDVIRVWERRYAAVTPIRSAGNHRLYSDEDIARFRLLAAATSHGRSIRNVATLSTEALELMVAEDGVRGQAIDEESELASDAAILESALECARSLDGVSLDRALRHGIARDGLPAFLEIDAPAFMRKVGDEWEAGRLTIASEHLAAGTVHAIILDAIRALPVNASAPRLLVATLSGERHGIGAALAGAVAALEGWSVINLGVDVPAGEVAAAAAATGARAVAVSVVHDSDRGHVLHELTAVRARTDSNVAVIVGGATSSAMHATLGAVGVTVCRSFTDFRVVLSRESAKLAAGVP